jgi:quinoprotein glucose dehydrogenase
LFSGRTAWDVPLGSPAYSTFRWMLVWLFRPELLRAGSPNLGGPMATAGGLVFSAASMDDHLRAFDSSTGQEVWKYALPAGGQATPMSYRLDGRQYVVIAAGGHGKLGTTLGDYVVAFTLP